MAAPKRTRAFYVKAVQRYFDTMDAGDVAGCVACFAATGTLTCVNSPMHLKGPKQLGAFFARLHGNTKRMIHNPTLWVVDVEKGTVAVELRYKNARKVGAPFDMENCNFFVFDAKGRFRRVHFWTGTYIDQKAAVAAARRVR